MAIGTLATHCVRYPRRLSLCWAAGSRRVRCLPVGGVRPDSSSLPDARRDVNLDARCGSMDVFLISTRLRVG
jgi:hypothetical protein